MAKSIIANAVIGRILCLILLSFIIQHGTTYYKKLKEIKNYRNITNPIYLHISERNSKLSLDYKMAYDYLVQVLFCNASSQVLVD